MSNAARQIEWIRERDCLVCTSHKATWKLARKVLLRRWCKLPVGWVCRHTCDNPKCINPAHIIAGTVGDNNRDTWRRNRHGLTGFIPNKGEKHRSAKLKEHQVREIRALIGCIPLRAIGRNYGVGLDAIRKIRDRRSWKHI